MLQAVLVICCKNKSGKIHSDNVVTFRIDQETGKLIDIGIETNIPTPVCLKFLN